MTATTPADAIRAAIGALPPNATGEQIAATVLRVAADEILPRPTTGDQSRQAGRYRLLRQQFLTAAGDLAGNPAPARLRHCPTHGQQGPEAWGCPECLRELRTELATAREAMRRLVDWGGFQAWHDAATGFDAETVTAVLDWFANGMTGPLPPLPPDIASRETVTKPGPAAPALPPALVHDGGEEVRIEAANRERTSWAVRDFGCCLNTSWEWEMEPCPSDRSADFLARTRWPSAAAAWDALQRSRAAEGVEG